MRKWFIFIKCVLFRTQKQGEVNGEDYFFCSRLQMQHDIDQEGYREYNFWRILIKCYENWKLTYKLHGCIFYIKRFSSRKIYRTRLLGRFTPIFYLNCEHVLFIYILKQSRKKFRGFLKKKFPDFQEFKFYKIKNLKNTFFKNLYHS